MNEVKKKDLGEIEKQMTFLVEEVTKYQEDLIASLRDKFERVLNPQSREAKSRADAAIEPPTECTSALAHEIKNMVDSVRNNNFKIESIINESDL